jgi:predicted molibdopterin-dependent oxidoreductase YjgC
MFKMFKTLPDAAAKSVTVIINGKPFSAPTGCTAAAALLLAGATSTRTTPVSAEPRAPYCMMGVCFECLAEIDGVPNQQACLVPVADGMRINRQLGAVTAKT